MAPSDTRLQHRFLRSFEVHEHSSSQAGFRAWAFGIARFKVMGWLRDKA